MPDHATSQTADGQSRRNAPSEIGTYMRAVILLREDHAGGDAATDKGATQGAQGFTISLALIG